MGFSQNLRPEAHEKLIEAIRSETDPVWKKVLVSEMKARNSIYNYSFHNGAVTFLNKNWDWIVDACGSAEAAVKYLEDVANGLPAD